MCTALCANVHVGLFRFAYCACIKQTYIIQYLIYIWQTMIRHQWHVCTCTRPHVCVRGWLCTGMLMCMRVCSCVKWQRFVTDASSPCFQITWVAIVIYFLYSSGVLPWIATTSNRRVHSIGSTSLPYLCSLVTYYCLHTMGHVPLTWDKY